MKLPYGSSTLSFGLMNELQRRNGEPTCRGIFKVRFLVCYDSMVLLSFSLVKNSRSVLFIENGFNYKKNPLGENWK